MGREQDWKEIEKTQTNYEQGIKDQYKGIDIIKLSKENRKTIHKMKKINAKSRNHLSSVTLFLPVESKRIEIVSLKIHHRINLVHNPFSYPALWVLINGKESIPSTGRIT